MGGRSTTNEYLQIDIRRLQRDRYLVDGRTFALQWKRNGEVVASVSFRVERDKIFFKFRLPDDGNAESTDQQYPVSITTTPCFFGGERPWFICPARGCGRRVAVLYCGGIFACRHCHGLAYQTQQEAPHIRALMKVQKIRVRLGGSGNLAEPFPKRPRGMHWKTYWRLAGEAE